MRKAFGLLLLSIIACNLKGQSPVVIPGDTAKVLQGSFSITDQGAAVYTFPITVTPGTGGLQPTLSVVYNSQGGDGIMGLGWDLTGLSRISRSSQTYSQDNRYGFNEFDSSGFPVEKKPLQIGNPMTSYDRFSLDGARMVLFNGPFAGGHQEFNGNYGQPNQVYRLENEQFTKIVSVGVSADGSPSYFIGFTKAGLIIEYGNSADSRIEAAGTTVPIYWLVSKISDTKGNYMLFQYNEDNTRGAYYISKILYTGNLSTSLQPYNSIEFAYESRYELSGTIQDIAFKYSNGSKSILINRLKQITVKHQGNLYRNYSFIYKSQSTTEKSLLDSIRTCFSDGSCMKPLKIIWDYKSLADGLQSFKRHFIEKKSENVIDANDLKVDSTKQVIMGDWNGDGLDDLLIFNRTSGATKIYIIKKSNFEYEIPLNNVVQSDSLINKFIKTADFNADGLTDLFYYDTSSGYNKVLLAKYTNGGISFYFNQDSSSLYTNRMLLNGGRIPAQILKGKDKQINISDFDNDGLPDLMIYNPKGFIENISGPGLSQSKVAWFVNNGIYNVSKYPTHNNREIAGFQGFLGDYSMTGTDSSRLIPIDLNDDNYIDLFRTATNGDNALHKQVGKSFSSNSGYFNFPTGINNQVPTNISNLPLSFADFNADGLVDLYYRHPDYNGPVGVPYLNKGNMTFEQVDYRPDFINNLKNYQPSSQIEFTDLNEDGRSDFLVFDSVRNTIYFNIPVVDTVTNKFILNHSTSPEFDLENPFDTAYLKPGSVVISAQFSVNTSRDFFIYDPKTGKNAFYTYGYYKQTNLMPVPELITAPMQNRVVRVQDGNDNDPYARYTLITYASLSDTTVVTNTLSTNTYPYTNIKGSSPIVKSFYTYTNSGRQTIYYYFENLSMNLLGRGVGGFEKITTSGNKAKTIKYAYKGPQRFLYESNPFYKTEIYEPGFLSTAIVNTINTEFAVKLDDPLIPSSFFSYPAREVQYRYETGGVLIDSVVNKQLQDEFGNVVAQLTDHGEGDIDSTINTYTNNFNLWLLGRLTRTELFRKSTEKPTILRTAAFEYDPVSGLLTSEIVEPDDPALRYEKKYAYDPYGNVTRTEVLAQNEGVEESRLTVTNYDILGRFVSTRTNPLGHLIQKTHDPKTGQTLQNRDENDLVTNYQYDIYGREILKTLPDGSWIKTDYRRAVAPGQYSFLRPPTDEFSTPISYYYYVYKQFSNAAPQVEYYGKADGLLRKQTISFSGHYIAEDVEYDASSDVPVKKKTPFYVDFPQDIYSGYFVATAEYDNISRLASYSVPDIGTGQRTFSKNYSGHTISETDFIGQQRSWTINARGLTKQVTDNQGNILNYDYDAAGNLIKVTDPQGNEFKWEYDRRGRKVKQIDPDLGTTVYQYNGFDELVSETNARGQQTQYKYDVLGRVIQKISPEGATNYTYDQGNKGIGQLSNVSCTNYHLTFEYDNFGRLYKENKTIKSFSYTTTYTYANGRLDKIKYPSGFEIQHVYNAPGYLAEIKRVSDGYSFWKALSVNGRGQVALEEFGNGFQTRYRWNKGTSFLDSSITFKNNLLAQSFGYLYDNIGNLRTRTNKKINKTEEFSYDDLNRLIKSKILNDSVTLTYDKLGNILTKSDVGKYYYGPVNNGPHRLIRVDKYSNVCIPSEDVTAEYTSFEKVKKLYRNNISELRIEYGADNQRMYQELYENNVLRRKKYYVNSYFEQEERGDTITSLHYIRTPEGVIAVYTSNNKGKSTINYWHKDHLGSLSSITDSAGNIVQELSYDSWGRRRKADWTAFPNDNFTDSTKYVFDRGFTTHEHYDLFDLVDMNGRVYDPVLGRFLSADPYINDITDLQSYNRYSYVKNNPLSYTDPSGYFFGAIFRAISRPFVALFGLVKTAVTAVAKFVVENIKTIAIVAVAVAVGAVTGGVGGSLILAAAKGSLIGFATSTTGALLNGASLKDALKAGVKGAVIGAVSAGIAYGIGDLGVAVQNSYGEAAAVGVRTAAHGVSQGLVTTFQGGRFSEGFWSGAISTAGEAFTTQFNDKNMRTAAAAIVGGTTSSMAGGKFANGAMSGAFVMMFNHDPHEEVNKFKKEWDDPAATQHRNNVVVGWTLGGAAIGAFTPPTALEGGAIGFVISAGGYTLQYYSKLAEAAKKDVINNANKAINNVQQFQLVQPPEQ